MKILVLLLVFSGTVLCTSVNDSYLKALKTSQDVDTLPDRGDYHGPYVDHSDTYVEHIDHPIQYTDPKHHYGPPSIYQHHELLKPIYGPPISSPSAYGTPISGPYGPSGPSGPSGTTAYGGPLYGHTTQIQFSPHSISFPHESWLEKLKLKFDLFTIGKIMLKLILFKKVIKFMAIICLIMFLPKLQTKQEVNEEERRFDVKYQIDTKLNEVTDITVSALNAFAKKNPDACPNVSCQFMKMFDAVDEMYSINNIIGMYTSSDSNSSNTSKVIKTSVNV